MKFTFLQGLGLGGIGGALLAIAIDRTCFPPRPEPVEAEPIDRRLAELAERSRACEMIASDVAYGRITFEEGAKRYRDFYACDPAVMKAICSIEQTEDELEVCRNALRKRMAALAN